MKYPGKPKYRVLIFWPKECDAGKEDEVKWCENFVAADAMRSTYRAKGARVLVERNMAVL